MRVVLIRRCCGAVLGVALTATIVAGGDAATDNVLRRVRGPVAYEPASGASPRPVIGSLALGADAVAVTGGRAAALLTLPDSSIVSLGSNTRATIGAFDAAAAQPGAQIQLQGGTVRFEIQRPQGGQANYRFVTNTSQVAVRGTIGLLSFINNVTTVACVLCAADSIAVTVGGQTFALAAGQALVISAAGTVATVAASSVVSGFSAAGVGTSAAAGPAAAIGAAGAAGAAAGTIGTIAAGAAAVGGGIAVANAARSTTAPATATPFPLPSTAATASPTPAATATPAPTATASPSASPSPSPTASASPSPSPSPTASASPSPSPSPSPTASASPSPSPSPTSTGTITVQRRPVPASAPPGDLRRPGRSTEAPR